MFARGLAAVKSAQQIMMASEEHEPDDEAAQCQRDLAPRIQPPSAGDLWERARGPALPLRPWPRRWAPSGWHRFQ
jgi:hypothetical protein